MRIRALAIALFVLVPLTAACGDDGGKDTSTEATTFCGVVTPVQSLADVVDKADDTKAVQSTFTEAESALAKVSGTPPMARIASKGAVAISTTAPSRSRAEALGGSESTGTPASSSAARTRWFSSLAAAPTRASAIVEG